MKVIHNSILIFVMLFLSGITVFAQDLGNVKGKVSTPSGRRLSNVKVTARQNGKNLRSSRTNRRGKFRLNGLQAGKYNLVFEKNGYSSGVMYDVLIKKKKTNNLEKKKIVLTIDEGTLVIIKGSVFDQFGKSVYGAKVRIAEIRSGKPLRKRITRYTSESGEFTFRFREGIKKFLVTATVKKISSSKEIAVSEAAIYRLALTLKLPVKKKKKK